MPEQSIGLMSLNQNEREELRSMLAVPAADWQFEAMCSLAAAIGLDTFSKSSLIRKHNQSCFQCAAAQFAAWRNAPGGRELRMKEREIYYYGYPAEQSE